MKRLLIVITASVLLGSATAQEPAKESAAPAPGAGFLARFDLDKDGSVGWEEFRKVKSGFAALDADGNGAITAQEFAKAAEERRERVRQAAQRRMRHWRGRAMRGGFGPWGGQGRGFGPMAGPGAGRCPCCGEPRGEGAMGPGQRRPMGPGPGPGTRRGGRGMGRGFGAGGGAPPPPPQR